MRPAAVPAGVVWGTAACHCALPDQSSISHIVAGSITVSRAHVCGYSCVPMQSLNLLCGGPPQLQLVAVSVCAQCGDRDMPVMGPLAQGSWQHQGAVGVAEAPYE